jgi:hypothetical protein
MTACGHECPPEPVPCPAISGVLPSSFPVPSPDPIPDRSPDPAETGLARRARIPGSGASAPSDGLQDWYVHMYVNDLPGTGRAANRGCFIYLAVADVPIPGRAPGPTRPSCGEAARRGGFGEVGRPAGVRRVREAAGRERLAGGRAATAERRAEMGGADGIRPMTIRAISGRKSAGKTPREGPERVDWPGNAEIASWCS